MGRTSSTVPVSAADVEAAFATLELRADATLADVRAARRRLAKAAHPDREGGDAARMGEINRAFEIVVRAVREGRVAAPPPPAPSAPAPPAPQREPTSRVVRIGRRTVTDPASFVVHAPPPEAFELLVLALAALGDLADTDPPHALEALLMDPFPCWCRLGLVAEAGRSTVSLTIAAADDNAPLPALDAVRDRFVAELNALRT